MEYIFISCRSYESNFWKTAQDVEKVLMTALLLLGSHDTYVDNGIRVPEGAVYLSRQDICKKASVSGSLRREFERLESKYGLIETSVINKKTYVLIKNFESCKNEDGGYSFGLPAIPGCGNVDDIGFMDKSYSEQMEVKPTEPISCSKTIIVRTQYAGFLDKKHREDYDKITGPLSENGNNWQVEPQNPTFERNFCHYFRTVKGRHVGNIEDLLTLFPNTFPNSSKNNGKILEKLPFFWQFGTTFDTPYLFHNYRDINGLQEKEFLNPNTFPNSKKKIWFVLPEVSSYSLHINVFYRTGNSHLFSDLYDICPDLIGDISQKSSSRDSNGVKRTISHPLNIRKINHALTSGECFKFYHSTLNKKAWFSGSCGRRITMLTMLMCAPLQESFSVNKNGASRAVSGELSMSYSDIANIARSGISRNQVWHFVTALTQVGFCKKVMSSGSSAILITNWKKYQMIFEMYDISMPVNGLFLSDYSFNLWVGCEKTTITCYIYIYYISTAFNINGMSISLSNNISNSSKDLVFDNSVSNKVSTDEEKIVSETAKNNKILAEIFNLANSDDMIMPRYGFKVAERILPEKIYFYTVKEVYKTGDANPEICEGGKYYTIAQKFYKYQQKTIPQLMPVVLTESYIRKGAIALEKMVRIDKQPLDLIISMLDYALDNEFWYDKVRSLPRLRQKASKQDIIKLMSLKASYLRDIRKEHKRKSILDMIGE